MPEDEADIVIDELIGIFILAIQTGINSNDEQHLSS